MRSSRPVRGRIAGATAAAMVLGLVPFVAAAPTASAAPGDLFISEYVEPATGNNKAVEIYNPTSAPVTLTGSYSIVTSINGGSSTSSIALVGTIAPNDVFVVGNNTTANDPAILAADQLSSTLTFNGDDAIVLRKGTTDVDVIGQVGVDPGTYWGTPPVTTMDHTLRRKASISTGDTNGADAFDPATEWDSYPAGTFDGLGTHTIDANPVDAAPTVTATTPAEGNASVALDSNVTVTFSEPVTAPASAFALACSLSGTKTFTLTRSGVTSTLDPTTSFAAGDACTLTVRGSAVSDSDTIDPPDTMASDVVVRFSTPAGNPCDAPITLIPAIQGSGATAAVTGPVTTRGVVVGDYEGPSPALRGFYLQDPTGDGDAATSDGIFVFEGSNANSVKLGDLVTVSGNAGENQGQTQVSAGTVTVCGTGSVSPTDVSFPVASNTTLEKYEGMLVRLPQTMTVTEHFQLGRFGQVTLSQGGRLPQPTNVVAPGAPAAALQAANGLRKIILDDATQAQNPDPIPFARDGAPLTASNTLRGGDTATGIVGVLNYTWGGNAASANAYRIRTINALYGSVDFVAANPRPTSVPDVGGTTRVVGMNLLNFFNTLDVSGINCRSGVSGLPIDCRGANTALEFERQWRKTVAAVSGTKADVVAFMEMENDGYGPDSAVEFLVDRLNDKDGAGTWAFIDADARTGQIDSLGDDAIKVGMLYKPGKVTPVGRTAVLNSVEFVKGGDSAPRNRPSLAQAFRDNRTGGTFVGVANHLKSKGSACAVGDTGDGQANCNAVRVRAAQLLADWLVTDPTGTGDPDVLILGDLNSYAKEDPITTLESKGYTNLIQRFNGAEAYSYAFDGQWGYLDHALGTASITRQVTGVRDWHVNADEPSVLDYNTEFKTAGQVDSLYAPDQFRISDHDPVVVGLNLTNATPVVGAVTVTPNPVSVGATVTVSAPFTDAEPADTHTATVAWGDGTTSTGAVSESAGTGSVSGSHTYTSAGVYTVIVTVTDQWGNHSSSSSAQVAVYDAAAGFVTGGGWFQSPVGSLSSNPSASGKAHVGISVKYRAGSAVPDGSFTLRLDGSSFAVASTSVSYLVISGETFRLAGTATVNGVAGFSYSVTATDGSKKDDSIRVVVRDSSGTVVYDSGTQTVKGQLKIHS